MRDPSEALARATLALRSRWTGNRHKDLMGAPLVDFTEWARAWDALAAEYRARRGTV